VVDDEAFTRAVLARLLGVLGVACVRQAGDGGEALVLLAKARVDLVFCDIEMQPIDGFSFLQRVRAGTDPALVGAQAVPVVLLTNRLDAALEAAGRALGVTVFLTKPIRPAQLRATVLAVLGEPAE